MKRLLVRSLLFLLLGATINVAVAVACAAGSPFWPAKQWPTALPEDHFWPVEVPADWPNPPQIVDPWVQTGFGLDYLDAEFGHTEDSGNPGSPNFKDQNWVSARIDAGWPWRSLTTHQASYEVSTTQRLLPSFMRVKWETGITAGFLRDKPGCTNIPIPLPYGPMWSGVIIGTLFWATLSMGVVLGIPAARRALRIRRGLCPACTYPVGTSPVCTECGTPVCPSIAPTANATDSR